MIINVNTHPIVVGTHEEYYVNWNGKINDVCPKLKNGKPIFHIIGSESSIELNTSNMKMIERMATKLTNPHGRKAVATDKAYIYIIEEDNSKTLLGTVTHNHIKDFRQMYDKLEYY